ncbi:MAG: energy-coupling factor ABC transporter substrate-binding protein [Oscillospiraceae bacterium]|jgi:cobalt/nickel transport protein
MSKNTKIVLILLLVVLVLVVVPFIVAPNAEFGGSDDAGSQMVEEIKGEAYEPWFTPILETAIGGELPGEIESLLFCIQTGIGVGVLAFGFGYFVARKKYARQEQK